MTEDDVRRIVREELAKAGSMLSKAVISPPIEREDLPETTTWTSSAVMGGWPTFIGKRTNV